jgi:hypothetical protein
MPGPMWATLQPFSPLAKLLAKASDTSAGDPSLQKAWDSLKRFPESGLKKTGAILTISENRALRRASDLRRLDYFVN